MIATLRQRNFALFWVGGLVSAIGDWVLIVGLPIYVYLLTHSVAATSITLISGIAPMIVLSSVAGVFVDRWNRQRTLVIVNILLALGLLPLLLVRSANDVWIVYAVNFIETCLEQFLLPTQNALVPAVVGEAHLVPANSLNALSGNLARLGGPPLGGLVAALFGITGMATADAASYLFAALCLVSMRLAVKPAATARAGTVIAECPTGNAVHRVGIRRSGLMAMLAQTWHEWADGLKLIASQRLLRVLVAVLGFAALGEGIFGPLYPVFVYQQLHGGALEIGELMSAQAVGGLLASLIVGWLGSRVMARWVAGLGWLGFGVIVVIIAFTPLLLPPTWMLLTGANLPIPVFWIEIGLFVAVGVPGLIGATGTLTLLQTQSPDAYRGRIFGAEEAIAGIMVLIGAVAAGALPEMFGVVPIFSGQGIAKIVGGLLMITLLPALGATVGKATSKTEQNNEGQDRVSAPIDTLSHDEAAQSKPTKEVTGAHQR